MTKSKLVQVLADANRHLARRDVEVIVATIFDEISEALVRGDRVELRGFGTFSFRKRDAGMGLDPRTGDKVVEGASPSAVVMTGGAHRMRRLLASESVTPLMPSGIQAGKRARNLKVWRGSLRVLANRPVGRGSSQVPLF